jgi:hypothetical protein
VTRVLWRTELALVAFSALSAVGGGVGMLLPGAIGLPTSMLEGSPFASFTVPALILLAVIGGTQTTALVLALRRRSSTLVWIVIAGFALAIWIFVEIAMVGFGALQAVYFAVALAQLALVFALLGLVRGIAPVSLRPYGDGRRTPRPACDVPSRVSRGVRTRSS